MQIQFLGAIKEVGGSRTLLTMPDGLKILIDFGMTQSNLGQLEESLKWNGREFEFGVEEIDYLVLTHGHFDHIGGAPLLIKRGFKGKIIATAPTAKFCKISLPDSARVMKSNCEWSNKRRTKNKLEPLYTVEEAEKVIKLIQCYDYNTEIVLNGTTKLELLCSGHMLGASMPKFTYKDKNKTRSIIFTGDTSAKNSTKPFLRPADDLGNVDYVITESTYGNRVHSKINPELALEKAIMETCIHNKKTVVIPVFSMQRSSEVLWMLREIYIRNKELYKIPIYLDSPMAIKSQKIMDSSREYWDDKSLERDEELTSLFNWEVIEYIDNYMDSMELKDPYPKIIVSSSGMCTGGRVLHHLQNFLPSQKSKIILCGYQSEGTLGRRLLETANKTISINRKQVIIRADIEKIDMSSHADMNQLTEFIKSTTKKGKLKQVFINHGDDDAMLGLKNELDRHLKSVDVIVPDYKKNYYLK